jgi:iron complex outermembrane receptor protein
MKLSEHTFGGRAVLRHVSQLATAAGMLTMSAVMLAQSATSGLKGTTADAFGGMIGRATVTAKNDTTGKTYNAVADAVGHFSLADLPAGSYTVQATAPGFAVATQKVVIGPDQPATAALTLTVSGTSDSVTVEANSTGSVAAALAPMDALLGETSARTEISAAFINNFTSPIADYGEIVQMVPSTFTLSSDGIGLGQSKTYFRGFPDGDYDIDFDGIPFYDTNTPTHHSWAFFPSMFIGGVDFDRSPGTASTIGPAPFGGSIHLLSKDLSPLQNVRATFSGGSFNTYLYDAQYDSGAFGPGKKFNTTIDVHHMQSHGWQSLNNQQQDGGDIKFEYRLSPKTILTGYSGVLQVNANTPNFSATRCQMYGVSATNTYSCTVSATSTTLLPYTGAGINFLLTNNSDPLLYLDTKYNSYKVPTDFEYVGVHKEFAHNIVLDIKPYTYNYDNGEPYANATTITELPASSFKEPGYPNGTHLGLPVAPCNIPVTKKGVTALPCAVDKYNSYRKYGETSTLSQVSKFGIFRAGMWYEWAKTNRHQYPTDPLNGFKDQALPNFAEKFVTNSYQPFAEYEFHPTSRLSITPGVKFSYYTVGTQQFADDGKTIGCLVANCANANPSAFISNGGSYFATLPSVAGNYRVNNGWSVYAQFAQGSIVPPSNVFDFNQGTSGSAIAVKTLPNQQKNTTYETGTILKLKNVTFDADYFHVHFDNGYSSVTTQASGGEPVFFATPPSVTQGLEGEANIYMTHGLSLYLNASYDRAVYSGGSLAATCTGTSTAAVAACNAAGTLNVNTPSGLDVQQTPSDIETEAILYQKGSWDAAFFNKRIGTYYIDSPNGYHDAYTVNPFSLDNLYVNYTIHSGGRFNNTKFRIDFTNIFNDNSINGITLANSSTAQTFTASNGAVFNNPFLATGQTPIAGGDNVAVNAGRSIMLTVTFGTSMKR